MVERGAGAVLNIASVAGFQPVPGMAVYSATKAFVQTFSEAVHEELHGTGVSCTVLCPGPVPTEWAEIADVDLWSVGIAPGFSRGCRRGGDRRHARGKAQCGTGIVSQNRRHRRQVDAPHRAAARLATRPGTDGALGGGSPGDCAFFYAESACRVRNRTHGDDAAKSGIPFNAKSGSAVTAASCPVPDRAGRAPSGSSGDSSARPAPGRSRSRWWHSPRTSPRPARTIG